MTELLKMLKCLQQRCVY